MDVKHTRNHGWTITSTSLLTDEAAQALTFLAEPKQVVMGDFVEVKDPAGTRIGYVAQAEYIRRAWNTAQVKVTIALH